MVIIYRMSVYKSNTKYKIKGYREECPISYKNKLLSLGLLPGKVLEIKRKALFGGPCQVSVRNADISIRIKELNLLELEEIN
ncbi:FeoA family protein [Pseudofrancisella aestuarii]|nr:FeoA domain-containing protein [Pseudofrancisella aestuarii]